ncbi:MAG: septum site-determining protein MinC [Candidatus Schekmanbacteria bacterium]|nr:septum site-determining protein MinC [Candidatus Schekmanbacteria bacterium]
MSSIELKGRFAPLTVIRVLVTDLRAVEHDLAAATGKAPGYFRNAPVVLDLSPVESAAEAVDLAELARAVRACGLALVGVQRSSGLLAARAEELGIGIVSLEGRARAPQLQAAPEVLEPAAAVATPPPAAASPPPPAAPPAPVTAAEAATAAKDAGAMDATAKDAGVEGHGEVAESVIVPHPARSGQRLYAARGDLIVLGAVSSGAELIAAGNIHVYGPLRGRAIAGAMGNEGARIFCQGFDAELISIAGSYMLSEDFQGEHIGKAVQVFLHGEKLTIEPLSALLAAKK